MDEQIQYVETNPPLFEASVVWGSVAIGEDEPDVKPVRSYLLQ
ncbi:MAG TPA: hypothetical protein VML19_19760 [Verrucomicrobiae bacterium]|nr:hypothetical protein [Verrucomicrobiae bacterium]